ncbi:MAG: SDR family oxidoreductase [Rhodospirillaceae bacterium]|nr:MAG: SDR family oxidoreductase [Rhodospirillaceae bacterium]
MGQAQNKRVVVVGGGQRDGATIGNGRAMAVLFARNGAEVLVVDRDLDRAEATVEQIKEESGRARSFAADVSQSKDCECIISHAVETMGGVEILVNNVGVVDGDSDGLSLAEEAWDRIMTINLKSIWLTSRACLPLMRKAGGGVIINISSIAALNMGSNLSYGMSKSGVNMLTTRLAKENAPYNVRVNAIMPGSVETPMFYQSMPTDGMTPEEYRSQRTKGIPLGRVGTAWDIAHAALFLASDEASFITGVLLPVDGGIHTR